MPKEQVDGRLSRWFYLGFSDITKCLYVFGDEGRFQISSRGIQFSGGQPSDDSLALKKIWSNASNIQHYIITLCQYG